MDAGNLGRAVARERNRVPWAHPDPFGHQSEHASTTSNREGLGGIMVSPMPPSTKCSNADGVSTCPAPSCRTRHTELTRPRSPGHHFRHLPEFLEIISRNSEPT